MRLIFLGTGAGFPSRERNVASCALDFSPESGETWLFDCGEGAQRRFMAAGLKFSRVDKIFITHLHGDHLFGLPGFLCTRAFKGGQKPLTVYGPAPIAEYLAAVFRASGVDLPYELTVIEVEEGRIFDGERFSVVCRRLKHRLPCFGYRLVEKDKPGGLNAEGLKSLGLPPGPLYQKLKRGEVVVLDDGRSFDGRDFLAPSVKSRIIAIGGDSEPCDGALMLAAGADVLVHEATFEADRAASAREHGHSTTAEAAQLALKAGVGRLIVTHISSRYRPEQWPGLLAQCRAIFPETFMAEDLSVFDL